MKKSIYLIILAIWVLCSCISGSVSKTIDVAPGVYILKLNDKVQKIVIFVP